MKKIIVGLLIAIIPSPAFAECTTGNCGVDVNCTTGEVTYYDVPINNTPPALSPEPVAPTHQVTIQTTNQSVGISGSYDAVSAEIARIATLPQPLGDDPCASGGCTKMIVNATTGEVQVLPLDAQDLAQRAIDRQTQYQQQLDLALSAQQALIQLINPEPELVITDPVPVAVPVVTESVMSAEPLLMALTIAPTKFVQKKSKFVQKKSKKLKKRKKTNV